MPRGGKPAPFENRSMKSSLRVVGDEVGGPKIAVVLLGAQLDFGQVHAALRQTTQPEVVERSVTCHDDERHVDAPALALVQMMRLLDERTQLVDGRQVGEVDLNLLIGRRQLDEHTERRVQNILRDYVERHDVDDEPRAVKLRAIWKRVWLVDPKRGQRNGGRETERGRNVVSLA